MRISLALLALASCHYRANGQRELVNWEDRLLKTAAFHLDCPAESLVVVDLGAGNVAGVSGCGRRAQYEYSHGSSAWTRSDVATCDCRDGPTTR